MFPLLWLLQEESGSTGHGTDALLETLKPHVSDGDYLILTVIMSVVTAVVSILFKSWIEDRFKKDMEAYKLTLLKELENYKREITRRDQAAKVAQLLALATAGTPNDTIKANQLSWELSLWLPADTAKKLGKVLARKNDAVSPARLLLDIRRILQGLDKDDLAVGDFSL
jgi:hypothetical protein